MCTTPQLISVNGWKTSDGEKFFLEEDAIAHQTFIANKARTGELAKLLMVELGCLDEKGNIIDEKVDAIITGFNDLGFDFDMDFESDDDDGPNLVEVANHLIDMFGDNFKTWNTIFTKFIAGT